MSRSALSILIFAIYVTLLGAVLVIVPNLLLSLFGIPPTQEVWIRVVGMLLLLISGLYYQMVRHDLTPIIRVTVPLRASVIVFFTAFALLDLVSPLLILFGAVDLAAAVWTALALRADSRS